MKKVISFCNFHLCPSYKMEIKGKNFGLVSLSREAFKAQFFNKTNGIVN